MDVAYVQADILFVVDVATVRQATDVIGLLLFIARILYTCSSFTGRLVWRYKLVNLAVPRRDFEAALKSATKTTAGVSRLYLLLNTECLGLRKGQSGTVCFHLATLLTLQLLWSKQPHMCATGAAYQADCTPSSIWRSVEKYLHDVDLSWFANTEPKGSPISSPTSARPDAARFVIIASEIPDCLPRFEHSAGVMRGRHFMLCRACKAPCALTSKVHWLSAERPVHSPDVERSTDLISAQLTAFTVSKLSDAGFKLF